MSGTKPPNNFNPGLFKAGRTWAGVVVACIVIVSLGDTGEAIGLSILVASASAALGCLAGFVLGIPRASAAESQDTFTKISETQAPLVRLAYNTNLVKISDWVTTLIVGLSLVHFRKLLDGLAFLGDKYASVFDKLLSDDTAASAYGLALTLTPVVAGALLMYMWTTTRLLGVLQDSLNQP